jgi:hypothetical protein
MYLLYLPQSTPIIHLNSVNRHFLMEEEYVFRELGTESYTGL